MSVPKVSIIVPCYNSEKWIAQCLESALMQTWENVEVIFVDNESQDSSIAIAQQIQKKNPNMIIAEAKNIYPNCWDESKQLGFELMSGKYVLVMGSDDYLHPKFIENCMKIILHAPDDILALQSPIHGVQADTGFVIHEISHKYDSIEEFKQQCMEKCPVNTPTVIYNTDLHSQGLLTANPETYGGAADYDLYCQLAENNIMIYSVPQWLGFFYRWHSGQATWKVHKENKNYDKMIQDYWRKKWQI